MRHQKRLDPVLDRRQLTFLLWLGALRVALFSVSLDSWLVFLRVERRLPAMAQEPED